MTVALRAPVAVGLNVTSIEHDAAGASESALAQVAIHDEDAGDGDADLRYAPQAAERAMLLGAFTQAAEQYARVVRHSLGQPAAVRASWLENQARAVYLSGQVAAAAEIITKPSSLLYVQALKFLQTTATPPGARRAVRERRVRRATRKP